MAEAPKRTVSYDVPDGRIVLLPKRNDYGEYEVRWMHASGSYDEAKSYHTDDWEDAVATAGEMADFARNRPKESLGRVAKALTESRPRRS